MTTFKQFLSESIEIHNGKIRITTQHDRAASQKDSISTYFKSTPYSMNLPGCNVPIHSLLNYVSSDISTEILKSLKGKGTYDVEPKQLDMFLTNAAKAAKKFVKSAKPDVIIYPKSSSQLLKKFVDAVAAEIPEAEVVDDSFVKSVLKADKVEALINTKHPAWDKFAANNPGEVEKFKKALKHHIEGGALELKKMYKPYLKFIKNFVEFRDASEMIDKVHQKNVLIIDDILSTGTTMAEMVRQLEEIEPSKIECLTLFKYTTAQK